MTSENPAEMLQKRLEGRTLVALSGESGISVTYLREIMNGQREPGRKVLDFLGLEKIRAKPTYRLKRAARKK